MPMIRHLAVFIMTLCLTSGCATKSLQQPVALNIFGDVNRVLNLNESGPGSLTEFQALYPKIRVQVLPENDEAKILHQSIEMISSHDENAPDIIEMPGSWIAEFASKGQLLPLDDWFATLPEPDRRDYVSSLLKSYSYQGHLYGIPSLIGIQYMYGRKELLSGAGLPSTLDELIAQSRDIHKNHGIQGVIFPSQGIHLAKFYYTLLQIELANTKCNDRMTAHSRAFNAFSILINENQPDYEKFTHAVAEGEFRSGKAGLSINGNYVWYLLSKSKQTGFPVIPEDVEVGYLPVANAGIEPTNYIWSRGYVINAQTKHPKEALLLLEYLTSTLSQFRRLKNNYLLPARTSAAFYGASLPAMTPAPAKALYKAGKGAPSIRRLNESPSNWKQATESIQQLLKKALASGMNPRDVAKEMIMLETMAE